MARSELSDHLQAGKAGAQQIKGTRTFGDSQGGPPCSRVIWPAAPNACHTAPGQRSSDRGQGLILSLRVTELQPGRGHLATLPQSRPDRERAVCA